MKKKTAKSLKIINYIALVLAIVWLVSKPDYEPAITSLVLLATLVGIYIGEKGSKNTVISITSGETHPYVITEPADSKKHALRCLSIGITNTGDEHLEKCLVKLERIKSGDGREFNNVFTPVGLATQHQRGQERKSGRFNLSPDETKYVLVACLNETEENSEIALQYETAKYPNLVPRGLYILTIRAYGANLASEKRFRLWVDENGYLKMRGE